MINKRAFVRSLLCALFGATALLAACAPRTGSDEIAATARGDELVVDIPALLIDFDGSGNATLGGLPLDMLTPGLLGQLNITTEQVQQLTAANIQHIQLNNRKSGLHFLVNGLSLPAPRWDNDSLMNIVDTLDLLDVEQLPAEVAQLLPLTQQIGAAIIVRFPLQAGAQAIPLYVEPNLATANAAQEQFLVQAVHPPQISVPVYYTENGSWSVNGLTEDEYTVLLPGVPWNTFHLSAAAIDSLKKSGISQLDIATDQDGIHLSLNEKSLPYIGWSNGELQNLLTLADQLGLLEQNGIILTPTQRQLIVETLLPMIQVSDVHLTIHFPP